MSGHSDSCTCPNCGGDADEYSDYKPVSYTAISCLHCGLSIQPTLTYMSLEELNERRVDAEMDELTELPTQDQEAF